MTYAPLKRPTSTTTPAAKSPQRRTPRPRHSTGFDANPHAGSEAVHLQPKLLVGATHDPLEQEADRLAKQFVDGPMPGSPKYVGSELSTRGISPKLRVGDVDNPLEREADRFADQVMRMPGPSKPTRVNVAPSPIGAAEPMLQRKCASCEDEDGQVHRSTFGRDGAQGDGEGCAEPGSGLYGGQTSGDFAREVDGRVRSGGRPLPPQARTFLEPRIGADLGHVRAHTDAGAGQLASRLNARAFTVQNDIFFAPGQMQPLTHSGMHLLAHEVAHTLQSGAPSLSTANSTADGGSGVVHRKPAKAEDNGCTNTDEEAHELRMAGRYGGILARWLTNRVGEEDLKVGRMKKLRARRARRACLMVRCGEPGFEKSQLDPMATKLVAFDTAFGGGKIKGECVRLFGESKEPTPVPEPAPADEREEPEECPGFQKPPATSGEAIWMVGKFPRPRYPGSNDAARAEAQAARHNPKAPPRPDRWAPATRDFVAAAKAKTVEVGSWADIRKAVLAKLPGSIAELNIVGHGGDYEIGLLGTIIPSAKGAKVNWTSGMDIGDFGTEKQRRVAPGVAEPGTVLDGSESMASRFASGAVINLYACYGGIGEAYGESLAKALCVTVRAPRAAIQYCPTISHNGSKITDRSWVTLGNSCEGRTQGFKNLVGLTEVGPNEPKPEPIPKPKDPLEGL